LPGEAVTAETAVFPSQSIREGPAEPVPRRFRDELEQEPPAHQGGGSTPPRRPECPGGPLRRPSSGPPPWATPPPKAGLPGKDCAPDWRHPPRRQLRRRARRPALGQATH